MSQPAWSDGPDTEAIESWAANEDSTTLLGGSGDGASSSTTSSSSSSSSSTTSKALCGCLTPSYYSHYFNVDTHDVKVRILGVFSSVNQQPNHFVSSIVQDQAFDAYGPFWNAMVLTFIVAVTSNLNRWSSSSSSSSVGEVDSIFKAMTFIYAYLFGVPLAIYLFQKFLGCGGSKSNINDASTTTEIERDSPPTAIPFIKLFSLYGYSMVWFTPTALLCTIPNTSVHWGLLLTSYLGSVLFLTKNLVSENNTHNKAIVGFVLGIQLLFILIMKLNFYVH